jgi:multidrug transporter EmrE-like cation transporter
MAKKLKENKVEKKAIEKKSNNMAKSKKANNNVDYKNNKLAIILVIICTIFTSVGQILMKLGTAKTGSILEIITNVPLILGFVSYGIGAVLLIISLKYGELSLVYPFIALSFIWVSIASIYLFNEHVSIFNWLGLTAILIGVSMIGYGSGK